MIAEVLSWKFKDKEGIKTKNGKIIEFPDGIPTQADQDLWTAEYNDYIAKTQYKQKRLAKYPSWNEQLDNIYHNGIDAWKADIKAIKDKYPKPE